MLAERKYDLLNQDDFEKILQQALDNITPEAQQRAALTNNRKHMFNVL